MEPLFHHNHQLFANNFIELEEADDIGCSVGLIDENDLFNWSLIFEGPSDTLYEVR